MGKKKGIYVLHDNDADGFGGAYAVWMKWGRKPRYFHFNSHAPVPEMTPGSDVYIIDGAPRSRAVLESLRERHERVVVLDHHQSALDTLGGLPDVHIDVEHSAAVIAWQYFHPDVPVPELLLYVEDRDLWRRALPGSDEVSAALESYPRRFDVWSELTVEGLRKEGAAILRVTKSQVRRICAQSREDYIGGYRVPIVNATAFVSDVCHLLLERYPEAPFSAAYYDLADGRRKWSLRGRGDFDVQALAVSLGGGGHRSAAGFVSPLPLGTEAP